MGFGYDVVDGLVDFGFVGIGYDVEGVEFVVVFLYG